MAVTWEVAAFHIRVQKQRQRWVSEAAEMLPSTNYRMSVSLFPLCFTGYCPVGERIHSL